LPLIDLAIYEKLPENCYVLTQIAKGNHQTDKTLKKFDIVFLDSDGKALMRIDNFTIREVPKNYPEPENRESHLLMNFLTKLYEGEFSNKP